MPGSAREVGNAMKKELVWLTSPRYHRYVNKAVEVNKMKLGEPN